MLNTVGAIIQYESGELSADDAIEFFGHLIQSGMAWQLQGHYGRTAQSLIDNGYIDVKGNILKYIED